MNRCEDASLSTVTNWCGRGSSCDESVVDRTPTSGDRGGKLEGSDVESAISFPPPSRGLRDRPAVPIDLDQLLANRFGLIAIEPMVSIGGSSTLNLLLKTIEGAFVVRLYRRWMTPARLGAIQQARCALAIAGIPCPMPRSASDGIGWIEVDGHLVEIEPYIEFDQKMDTWERLEQGLELLGRIHERLALLNLHPAGRYAPASNSIDRNSFVDGVRRGAARLREFHASTAELTIADHSEGMADRVAGLERDLRTGPDQLVHGDYWDDNVYFQDGRIVLVADLDFMGARPRVDDLALTLYYTNSTFDDDQVSEDRIRRIAHLVDAYDSGLDRRLSFEERQAIPLAIARTAIGFVAQMPFTDSDEGIRRLAAELAPDFRWVNAMLDHIDDWQAGLQLS